MEDHEQRSRNGYVTDDFIPGTDVLAVDRKDSDPGVAPAPKQSPPEVDRDATLVPMALDDPVTDRNGQAPNPPNKPPRRARLSVDRFEVQP